MEGAQSAITADMHGPGAAIGHSEQLTHGGKWMGVEIQVVILHKQALAGDHP
jgi:hypothetical protein